jgi:2-polyprenyl-6-methoxyphenol hydroxylase-like FAD-dependent oxidoreductase
MGLLEQVKERDTGIGDCTIVDADGEPYAGELEVLIDELVAILHQRAAGSGVEFRFGDSITALIEDDHGVTVTFQHGAQERFDLMIGADGAHSQVRRLVFGPESTFAHHLGCHYGFFEIDNYLHLDHAGMVTTLIALPAGVWLARQYGFEVVFVATAAAPLLALVTVPFLPRRRRDPSVRTGS